MKLRQVILLDGTEKIEIIQDSSKVIEERKKLHSQIKERKRLNQIEYRKEMKLSPDEREKIRCDRANERMIRNFWRKIDKKKEDECWIWKGAKSNQSLYTLKYYGFFKFNGITISAHRASYIMYNGNVPEGVSVLHKCDNGLCVNPHHLFLGTQEDNVKDMFNKRRNPNLKGEKNPNSKLTLEQVYEIRNLYKTNKYTYYKLGIMFGVSLGMIAFIIRNENWKE